MCCPCIPSSMIYSFYLAGRSLQRSPKASGLIFSVILLLHLSAEFDTVATLCFVKYFPSLSLGNIILYLPSLLIHPVSLSSHMHSSHQCIMHTHQVN